MTPLGIDLFVARGPTRDEVLNALSCVAGLDSTAIKLPDEPEDRRIEIMNHDAWAVMYDFDVGDLAFKIDLDGVVPRDYEALARRLARHLSAIVVRPDESTLAPLASILVRPDGSETPITLEDIEPDGYRLP